MEDRKRKKKHEKEEEREKTSKVKEGGAEDSGDAINVDARARVRTRGRREWPLIKKRIMTPGFVSILVGSVLRHSIRRMRSRTELLSVYLVTHSHPLLYLRAEENL